MLCPCSLIILIIYSESQMYIWGVNIHKDIWVSLQGGYIRGAYTWDFTVYKCVCMYKYISLPQHEKAATFF